MSNIKIISLVVVVVDVDVALVASVHSIKKVAPEKRIPTDRRDDTCWRKIHVGASEFVSVRAPFCFVYLCFQLHRPLHRTCLFFCTVDDVLN